MERLYKQCGGFDRIQARLSKTLDKLARENTFLTETILLNRFGLITEERRKLIEENTKLKMENAILASMLILIGIGSVFAWIPIGLYIYLVLLMACSDASERSDAEWFSRAGADIDPVSGSEKYSDDFNDEQYYTRIARKEHIFDGMSMTQAKSAYRHIMKTVHSDNGGDAAVASEASRQYQEYVRNSG